MLSRISGNQAGGQFPRYFCSGTVSNKSGIMIEPLELCETPLKMIQLRPEFDEDWFGILTSSEISYVVRNVGMYV